jgi:hypothetical protein
MSWKHAGQPVTKEQEHLMRRLELGKLYRVTEPGTRGVLPGCSSEDYKLFPIPENEVVMALGHNRVLHGDRIICLIWHHLEYLELVNENSGDTGNL